MIFCRTNARINSRCAEHGVKHRFIDPQPRKSKSFLSTNQANESGVITISEG